MAWKFYRGQAKRLKLKVTNVSELVLIFGEVT